MLLGGVWGGGNLGEPFGDFAPARWAFQAHSLDLITEAWQGRGNFGTSELVLKPRLGSLEVARFLGSRLLARCLQCSLYNCRAWLPASEVRQPHCQAAVPGVLSGRGHYPAEV